jgi:hypothetical protein
MEIKYIKMVQSRIAFRVQIEIVYTREFLEHMYNLYNSQYLSNFENINPQLPAPAPAEISSPEYYENLLQYRTNRPPAPTRNPDWDVWRARPSLPFYRNRLYFTMFRVNGFEDMLETNGDITDLDMEGRIDNTGLIIKAYRRKRSELESLAPLYRGEAMPPWGRWRQLEQMGFSLAGITYNQSSPQAERMINADDLFAMNRIIDYDGVSGRDELLHFLSNLIEDRNSLDTHGVPVIRG